MRMKAPRLGDQFPEIEIAENQHEYKQITAAAISFDDGTSGICTRWEFTNEEREKIARGEDLYVTLMGIAMQPITMSIGRPDWLGE